MDVFDESAQICDGFFGHLAVEAVRMVEIPECCNIIRSDLCQYIGKTGSIGIDTVCFDEQRNAGFFGNRC